MYGHTHDVQRHGITHIDGAHHAWSLGCLKDMSKEVNEWLKGRQTNWCHAFAVIDWFDDNNFRIDVIDIYKGKTYVWGKLIDGNT
jgi:hypothetical protein